jgi:hypothetical protein
MKQAESRYPMMQQPGSLSPSLRRRALLWSLAWLALADFAGGSRAASAASNRDVLGVAHVAGKYNFTAEDYLNEGADRILELGSRVIKVWLSLDPTKSYPFNSDWEPLPTELLDLVQRPYYQELFAKPFKVFLLELVTAPEVYFVDGMSPEETERERVQAYSVARHLLTAYAGSGKTFVLQNWEGDHLLRQGLPDESVAPDEVRIQGMIDWLNARQAGVEQARSEVAPNGVEVWHAVEVNHLGSAMKGRVTATNNVIPFTRADLYSYSTWDIGFDARRLVKALDHLAAKAPDSKAFGAKNIYVGEFGAAIDHLKKGQTQRGVIRKLAEAALGWGVRWAVYWQVYCNEPKRFYRDRPKNRHMRGFWLVRPDGTQAPMWDDFRRMLLASTRQISLRSSTGQYVAPEEIADEVPGGETERVAAVRADRWTRGNGETLTLWDWNGGALEDGDLVSLMVRDGSSLAVEPGEGGRLVAMDPGEAEPERFSLRTLDGGIALQTASGWYLGAGVGGDGEIRALWWEAGPAERFELMEE